MRFRDATEADLAAVVALLADDPLGATRESPGAELPPAYAEAFAAIAADPNNRLIVADDEGAVVGCLQLTFIPGLSRQGMTRALVEAVRVDAACRGAGIGRRMMAWAIERARQRGCGMIQLTSDKSRTDAHRFYEALGFVRSHEGMKLML